MLNEIKDQVAQIGNELSAVQKSLLGVDSRNLQQFFLMHRHDGSALSGALIYGPYFIRDTANGKTYKIVCTNGVLGTAQV